MKGGNGMLQTLLGVLNYGVLLLFGVYVSAAFTGIILNKKISLRLLCFSAVNILVQIACFSLYGMTVTERLYPFISHLPLALFLIFVCKKNTISSIISIMSAYLCCQLSKWVGILTLHIMGEQWISYGVRFITTVVMGILIIKWIAPSVSLILSKSKKIVLSFGLLPSIYYLFDYFTTVYTNLLYSGSQTVFEFLPFILCVAYIFFCIIYFKEYEEKCEMERRSHIVNLQAVQYRKEIESIRHSEYEISRLRHDMRHFLVNIKAFIENGAIDKSVASIEELIDSINLTTIHKFCENDLTNMVLSYYENLMKDKEIKLQASVKIPKVLPCSDMDFTSILANGLENALQAVAELEKSKRIINLELKTNGDKLLLSIKNPYVEGPKFIDGVSSTEKSGHGIGTQSIRYVTEKLKGNCQFTTQNEFFILRVIL